MNQFTGTLERKGSQGFTIVELVVVIILLGILAATALPRFMDIDDDAHAAAFDGVMGGFSTGVALYHAQWIAEGQEAAGTAVEEFGNLRVNAVGYPYSLTANVNNQPESSADCADVFANILQAGPTVSNGADTSALATSGTDYMAVEASNVCAFYYTGQSTTVGATIPLINYAPTTGVVTRGTINIP